MKQDLKKAYQTPDAIVTLLEHEDVIRTSSVFMSDKKDYVSNTDPGWEGAWNGGNA